MKRTLLLTAGLAFITLITGCFLTSVYPYYTAKDVVFDPALIGVWTDTTKTNADTETWTFEKIDAQTYKFTVNEDDKKTEFDARLFKLGGQTFLDCLTRQREATISPAHVLLLVKSIQPQLEINPLNYEWIAKLLENNPKAIRHVITPNPVGSSSEGGSITLTADTAELQKFVLKHLKTQDAWGKPAVMGIR